MVWQIRLHAADNAQIIRVLRKLGKHFRNPQPRLAMLGKPEGGPHELRRIDIRLHSLACAVLQFGLVVEEIHMRWPAVHA